MPNNVSYPGGPSPQEQKCEQKLNGRMASFEMLRCDALVSTDVSEELSASIIRATRIGELGTS
jgi:hypothetical protein